MLKEPFKGLNPFGEDDQDIFYGRNNDIELITDHLRLFRLTILHGASGVGKSSILRAGVTAKLRQEAKDNQEEEEAPLMAIVVFPPLNESWLSKEDNLFKRLKEQIEKNITEIAPDIQVPDEEETSTFISTLETWTERIGQEGKLLIIFDQFEDFFLAYSQREEEKIYAEALARAVNYFGLRVNFLISIRSSEFTKLERFKSFIPNLMDKSIELKRLFLDSAKAAIRKPIEAYNRQGDVDPKIEIKDDLVEEVLNLVKAGEKDEFEAAYLQLVMQSLWDKDKEKGSLELQTLKDLGGAKGIVETHFKKLMNKLDGKEWDIAIYIFDYLVTPSGEQIAQKVKDLSGYYNRERTSGQEECQEHLVKALLEKLSDSSSRILRACEGDRYEIYYEIYFKILAGVISDWLKIRRQIRNLADDAEKAWQNFDFSQIQALKAAIKAGESLQEIIDKEPDWLKYPRTIPIIGTLRSILENIREKREFKRPNSPIYGASISPDGKLLATASFDGTVYLWGLEPSQEEPIKKFQDPSKSVFNLIFSSDGKRLATTSWDGTVRLWDLEANESPLKQLGQPGDEEISLVAFSSDGEKLATASLKGNIRLWNLQESSPEPQILPSPNLNPVSFVHSLNFVDRGDPLVISFWDGSVYLWDWLEKKVLQLGELLKEPLQESLGEPQLLATASQDGMVKLWDLANPSEAKEKWQAHNAPISYTSYNATKHEVDTVSWNGKVRRWNIKNKTWCEFSCNRSPVSRGSFSPDREKLVTVASDGSAHLWDLSNDYSLRDGKDQRVVYKGHEGMVYCVSFSPDGQRLATASADKTVRLWDCQGKAIKQFDFKNPVFRVSFSPNERYLGVATADPNGTACLVDLNSYELKKLKMHDSTVYCINFHPHSNQIASASEDGTVRRWDLNGTPLGELSPKSGTVYYVSFSPDGQKLAMACLNGNVFIHDLQSKEEVQCIGHSSAVYCLSFSPDGQLLASASQDGTARLWDLKGKEKATFKHESMVFWVSFQPGEKPLINGELLATAAGDGKACLWNLKNNQKIAEVKQHDGMVFSVCFNPRDMKQMATASSDKTVKLGRIEDLKQLLKRGHDWLGIPKV